MVSKQTTTTTLCEMKQKDAKITMLTAYDFPAARLLNEAGVDVILIGDSVGMVKLGYESTLPVTVEEMLHHVKAVKRGNTRALLVADMPYLSYELDCAQAARNAGRLVKEGGAHAVKIEGGGLDAVAVVKELLRIHIPVMGHLGLTPQSINRLGGYKVQGRAARDAERIIAQAQALENAGVFALVLECIPSDLARKITSTLSIPTIGIGAGPHCDGQVLVLDDALGLTESGTPKFVKHYANLRSAALAATSAYCHDVRKGLFPAAEHEFKDTPR